MKLSKPQKPKLTIKITSFGVIFFCLILRNEGSHKQILKEELKFFCFFSKKNKLKNLNKISTLTCIFTFYCNF
ncbi:hypothetical protein DCO46_05450 [Flavobacterium sp. HTF]|nr:hypothetical protein DCO46_05450 [Flavobacterium sp. HTF]